jgi:hypothetical protein
MTLAINSESTIIDIRKLIAFIHAHDDDFIRTFLQHHEIYKITDIYIDSEKILIHYSDDDLIECEGFVNLHEVLNWIDDHD